MKTIQTFNLLVVALLLGLFWFADQNSKALSQYSQSEAMFSTELEKHAQAVLSGEKKENVDHLIAVIQKISATSSSGSNTIQAHADSINNMRTLILSLLILQIAISIMYYLQYNKSLKSGTPESGAP